MEHVAPRIGEGPEGCRYVCADRLALGARGALAAATVELLQHRFVFDRRGVDIADTGRHWRFSFRRLRTAVGGSGYCKRLQNQTAVLLRICQRVLDNISQTFVCFW